MILNSSPATCCEVPLPADADVDLARIGFGVGDELRNSFCWKRWIHEHYKWLANDARNRRDVAYEIETELIVQRCVDHVHRSDKQERVTVRSSTHDRLGAYIGAGARSVLDDEWLAEPLRQPVAHQASDDVGPAAGGNGTIQRTGRDG